MILLIDNYDSFSYNLYQLIGFFDSNIRVLRNDAITTDEIADLEPDAIILSPGPGRPEEAGICIEVVRTLGDRIPVLGVCLGHQAICTAYGAKVTYAKQLMHGKQSIATIDVNNSLFIDCPASIPVARYHSLAVDVDTIPNALKTIAITKEQEVMAVKHVEYNVYGLQFHPESVLTPNGTQILRNFINLSKESRR